MKVVIKSSGNELGKTGEVEFDGWRQMNGCPSSMGRTMVNRRQQQAGLLGWRWGLLYGIQKQSGKICGDGLC